MRLHRQLSGVATEGTPLLYDVVLLSPRALADAHGGAAPETDAAVGALARLVSNIQASLQSLHGNRRAKLPVLSVAARDKILQKRPRRV